MPDRYQQFLNTPIGKQLSSVLPLPNPPVLRRYDPGDPIAHGPVMVGAAPHSRLAKNVEEGLAAADVDVRTDVTSYVGRGEGDAANVADEKLAAIVFDATGISESTELRALHDFFPALLRKLLPSGRVIVFGSPPEDADSPRVRAAQRALEGFVRSLGKELRDGSTAQTVYVAAGAEDDLASTLRFLVSGRSAYVSGQVIRVRPAPGGAVTPADWNRPLADKVALVTGASRGIGEAIARTLARDGAHVICLDIPQQGDALARVANDIGGTSLQVDITSADAPKRIIEHLRDRHDGVDVVVHNAGITRDRMLVNLDAAAWQSVIDVNLAAQERINEALLDSEVLRDAARIVCVSSVGGIAGNRGQTNYAASKAGIIGMVDALAPTLADRNATINAVAPGFIETEMTAKMPMMIREFGRRLNSLSQGGQPGDVAETIAWLASPASGGINGNVVRVCGQSLLGA